MAISTVYNIESTLISEISCRGAKNAMSKYLIKKTLRALRDILQKNFRSALNIWFIKCILLKQMPACRRRGIRM